ncbi:MAG: sulfotransferase family protein [Pseudomonadota bacterium]
MTLKIIGAGFGRTGTMSLKYALETLGFGPCYHMEEVFDSPDRTTLWDRTMNGESVNWDDIFAGFSATVDWPACTWWRELAEHYPDAKVLLSVRSAESWHRSACNTIYHTMTMDFPSDWPADAARVQSLAHELIIERTFNGKLLDADHAKAIFDAHNLAVQEAIPANRLIVYETGSGWEPLCSALGVPVPDTEFPKTNTTSEYREELGLAPIRAL